MKPMAIPNTPPPAGNPNHGLAVFKALFLGLVLFLKAIVWLTRAGVSRYRSTLYPQQAAAVPQHKVLQMPDLRQYAGAQAITSIPLDPPVAVIRLQLHQVEEKPGQLGWKAFRTLSIQEDGLAQRLGGRVLDLGEVKFGSGQEAEIKAAAVKDAQAFINRHG